MVHEEQERSVQPARKPDVARVCQVGPAKGGRARIRSVRLPTAPVPHYTHHSLRFSIVVMREKWGYDKHLGFFAARLSRLNVNGKWHLAKLLDEHGRDCHAALLVRFTYDKPEA